MRRYDEYLTELDFLIGNFLESLEKKGILDNTIVIVTSDHGESFQGGYVGHGGGVLPEAQIHVPLIMHFPKGPKGVSPITFVSPLDVAPTILGYLNIEAPKSWRGENMWPYIKDPQMRSQTSRLSIAFEALLGLGGEIAVFSGKYKIVFRTEDRRTVRVYDLDSDPAATIDISERFGDRVRAVVDSVPPW